MFQDNVKYWRFKNVQRILEKAKWKIYLEEINGKVELQIHPKVALAIIEQGSLNEDDEIQELWAGLFAASCNPWDSSDENIIFVDLLKQITSTEAVLLKYGCEKGRKILYWNWLVSSSLVQIKLDDLKQITWIDDIHRLDRQLDHLRSLGLIGHYEWSGGFTQGDVNLTSDITPTPLALNLYARTAWSSEPVTEYWKDEILTEEQFTKEITTRN